MKKTKLITDHPDYWLLVNMEDSILLGDWYTDGEELFKGMVENIPLQPTENFWKIIGHLPKDNAPLLEGVPLLVPITSSREEKDVEKLVMPYVYEEAKQSQAGNPEFDKYWETAWTIWWGLMDTSFKNGLINAYKAASKGYTEDDLLRFGAECIHTLNTKGMGGNSVSMGLSRQVFDEFKPFPAIPTPIDFIPVLVKTEEVAREVWNKLNKDFSEEGEMPDFTLKAIPNEQNIPVIQGEWIFK